jgi:hypothetical protein
MGARAIALFATGVLDLKLPRTKIDNSSPPQEKSQEFKPIQKVPSPTASPFPLKPVLLWLLLGMALFFPFWEQRNVFFLWPADKLCRGIYGTNPFPECREIAKYIQSHTTPDESIAVLGSEPEVYFYSHRRSATGYIYTYGLLEPQPFAQRMQREMAAEIERSEPKFILFVDIFSSWMHRKVSNPNLEIVNWGNQYLEKYYLRVGVADIRSFLETDYIWGGEARDYKPQSSYYLELFERK